MSGSVKPLGALTLAGVLAAAAATMTAGCQRSEATADTTALLVMVSSDVSDSLYDGVRVSAVARGKTHVWPDPSRPIGQRPPFSVSLVPEGSDPGPIDVTAQLLAADGTVVMEERATSLRFAAGQQMVLTLALDSACLMVTCPDETTTCHRGVCRDVDKPAADELAPLAGDGTVIAVGSDGPDAGSDAGHDSADDDDAGPAEAGTVDGADAASDEGGAGGSGGSDAGGSGGNPGTGGATVGGGPCVDDTACLPSEFCEHGRCLTPPPPEVTSDAFDRYCAMPYVPACAPPVDEPFTAARPVAVSVNYQASPNLVVPITVLVWLDADTSHSFQSRSLQPGDFTGPMELGTVGKGAHTVHMQATATRPLSEWKGAVKITTTWAH